jgi:hypothetical protein
LKEKVEGQEYLQGFWGYGGFSGLFGWYGGKEDQRDGDHDIGEHADLEKECSSQVEDDDDEVRDLSGSGEQ